MQKDQLSQYISCYSNENQQKQDKSSDQLEDQPIDSHSISNESEVIESAHYQTYYQNFKKGKSIPDFNSFQQIFSTSEISYHPHLHLFYRYRSKKVFSSRNHRIMKFQTFIYKFRITINVLNLTKEDQLKIDFDKPLDQGSHGRIFEHQRYDVKYAVKQIPFDMFNAQTVIKNTIKEYAFNLLFSFLEIAPASKKLFGFDLVTTENAIYFSNEKGIAFDEIMNGKTLKQAKRMFEELEISLLLMHKMNITHNDIKPQNIVYSPSLKKLVFIDFGLSEINIVNQGYMKKEKARGTVHYCCDGMRKLFLSEDYLGFVDMYFNDYVSFQKTFRYVVDLGNLNQPQQMQSQDSKSEHKKDKVSGRISQLKGQGLKLDQINKNPHDDFQSSVAWHFENLIAYITSDTQTRFKGSFSYQNQINFMCIYIIYLIFQCKSQQMNNLLKQDKQIINILNISMKRILFIFLYSEYSLAIHSISSQLLDLLNGSVQNNYSLLDIPHQSNFEGNLMNFDGCSFTDFSNPLLQKYLTCQTYIAKQILLRYQKRYHIIDNLEVIQKYIEIQVNEYNNEKIQQAAKFILNFLPSKQLLNLSEKIHDTLDLARENMEGLQFYLATIYKLVQKLGLVFLFKNIRIHISNDPKKHLYYLRVLSQLYFSLQKHISSTRIIMRFLYELERKTAQRPFTFAGMITFFQTINSNSESSGQINPGNSRKSNYYCELTEATLKYKSDSQQIYIDAHCSNQLLVAEFVLFQRFLQISVKLLQFSTLIMDYEQFKSSVKVIQERINKILTNFLLFKVIMIKASKDTLLQEYLFEFGDFLISKYIRHQVKILLDTFFVAQRLNDLAWMIEISASMLDTQKMIKIPQHVIKFAIDNQVYSSKQNIYQCFEQQKEAAFGILPELIKQSCSIIIFIRMIPQSLCYKYMIKQKIQDILRKLKSSKLKDKEFLSQNFLDIQYFQESVRRYYNQINYNGKPKTYPKLPQTFRNINFVNVQQSQKINEAHSDLQSLTMDQVSKKTQHQFCDKQQIAIKIKKCQDYWNQLTSIKIRGFQQRLLSTFKIVLFKLQSIDPYYFQTYLTRYDTLISDKLSRIRSVYQQFHSNRELSNLLFIKLKLTYYADCNFWKHIFATTELIIKLKTIDYILLKKESISLETMRILVNYWIKISSTIQCQFSDKNEIPLQFYQTQITLKMRKEYYQLFNINQEIKRLTITKLIKNYFRRVKINEKSRQRITQVMDISHQFRGKHFNELRMQRMYLEILISQYTGQQELIPQTFIFDNQDKIQDQKCDQADQNGRQKINVLKNKQKINVFQSQKIVEEMKRVFHFMSEQNQVHRFFSQYHLYIKFLYYLIQIGVQQFVCENLTQNQNKLAENSFFLVILLKRLIQFATKLPCSNYTYYCIKIFKKIIEQFLPNTVQTNQNSLQLLMKFKTNVYQKIVFPQKTNTQSTALILILECQKTKYYLLRQKMISKSTEEMEHCIDKAKFYIKETSFYLKRVGLNMSKMEYFSRIYTCQDLFKLILQIHFFVDKTVPDLMKTQSNELITRHQKSILYCGNKRYKKLRYFRAIIQVQNYKFRQDEELRRGFLLNLKNKEEVFEGIQYKQFKGLIMNDLLSGSRWQSGQRKKGQFNERKMPEGFILKMEKKIMNRFQLIK